VRERESSQPLGQTIEGEGCKVRVETEAIVETAFAPITSSTSSTSSPTAEAD
jgi:hypothetical protein